MCNIQWNCFNLVDTCNIALILFLKCDVTKFRIRPPPSLSHNDTLCRLPLPPLTCDVIYGWPLIKSWMCVFQVCLPSIRNNQSALEDNTLDQAHQNLFVSMMNLNNKTFFDSLSIQKPRFVSPHSAVSFPYPQM